MATKLLLRCCLSLLFVSGLAGAVGDDIVVIAHASLPKTDRVTLQRLYTGRIVSIGQQSVVPINLPAGALARDEFLQWVMEQNEEQYTGYWLVRRYVGKGSSPKELGSVEEVTRFRHQRVGARTTSAFGKPEFIP